MVGFVNEVRGTLMQILGLATHRNGRGMWNAKVWHEGVARQDMRWREKSLTEGGESARRLSHIPLGINGMAKAAVRRARVG